jgi:hypothetical protein
VKFDGFFKICLKFLDRLGPSASVLFSGMDLRIVRAEQIGELKLRPDFLWIFVGDSLGTTLLRSLGLIAEQERLIESARAELEGLRAEQALVLETFRRETNARLSALEAGQRTTNNQLSVVEREQRTTTDRQMAFETQAREVREAQREMRDELGRLRDEVRVSVAKSELLALIPEHHRAESLRLLDKGVVRARFKRRNRDSCAWHYPLFEPYTLRRPKCGRPRFGEDRDVVHM